MGLCGSTCCCWDEDTYYHGHDAPLQRGRPVSWRRQRASYAELSRVTFSKRKHPKEEEEEKHEQGPKHIMLNSPQVQRLARARGTQAIWMLFRERDLVRVFGQWVPKQWIDVEASEADFWPEGFQFLVENEWRVPIPARIMEDEAGWPRHDRGLPRSRKVSVRPTPRCGLGLFAAEKVPAGAEVGEYVGVVTYQHQYVVKPDGDNFGTLLNQDYMIDARTHGNLMRFANHCCQPNCRLVEKIQDGYAHVYVMALVGLEIDEEITLMYAEDFFGQDNEHCRCKVCHADGEMVGMVSPGVRDSEFRAGRVSQVK